MTEIRLIVEEAPEGGLIARAVDADIYPEAYNIEELHVQVRDAVRCHFDEGQMPSLIRLHITREEVLAARGFRAICPVGIWSSGSATKSRARPVATSA